MKLFFKSTIYCIIFTIGSSAIYAQSVASLRIDERLETISIACKLAGIEGFYQNQQNSYTKAINKHFKKYDTHPFVQYLVIHQKHLDTAYWEIQALAVHLSQPPLLKPLVSYSDSANAGNWDNRALLQSKVVLLLQQFHKDTDCKAFFKSQRSYFSQVEASCNKQTVAINKKWFTTFFKMQPTEKYYPILALGMKYGAYLRVNYGNNIRDTYTIIGCDSLTSDGLPVGINFNLLFNANLHEYIHCYANQLVDNNIEKLQFPAEILLAKPEVYEKMKNTFYGNWQFLLYESMVRACTIKYLMDNEKEEAVWKQELEKQEKAGFFWMQGLVDELHKYKLNQTKYKNINEYMPLIIKWFNIQIK